MTSVRPHICCMEKSTDCIHLGRRLKLMEEEQKRQQARGLKNKTIRVMILGIPNVGKSSLINRLAKKNTVDVANRPGVTRSKQWIRIGNNQELLDTPGVLWPKFESEEVALNLAYTGSIKDGILEKVEIAYNLLKYLHFQLCLFALYLKTDCMKSRLLRLPVP